MSKDINDADIEAYWKQIRTCSFTEEWPGGDYEPYDDDGDR